MPFSKTVDAVISSKNKDAKQNISFDETEVFCDPRIANSYSEPDLYGICSIKMAEVGKDSDKLWFCKVKGGVGSINWKIIM